MFVKYNLKSIVLKLYQDNKDKAEEFLLQRGAISGIP